MKRARAQQIEEALTAYVTEFGHKVAVWQEPADWEACAETVEMTQLHRLTGWAPPEQVGDEWVLSFCPAVMAETSADLDDRDFKVYLVTVKTITSWHMSLTRQGMTLEEREGRIDRDLCNRAAGSARILSLVQLRAIDALAKS